VASTIDKKRVYPICSYVLCIKYNGSRYKANSPIAEAVLVASTS